MTPVTVKVLLAHELIDVSHQSSFHPNVAQILTSGKESLKENVNYCASLTSTVM